MRENPGHGNLPEWKEIDRLAALETFGILDTEPEIEFDNIAEIAAQICHTPIAFISFIDENRQWLKAKIGLEETERPRSASICNHAIQQSDLFVIPDLNKDHRFQEIMRDETMSSLSFYAGAPLKTKDGLPLGMLCVLDHHHRPEGLSEQQKKALAALARTVMCQLELKLANRTVAESEEFTRRLLASSDDCIQVFDLKGRLRFMSQGGIRALEIPDFSTLEGCHWSGIWSDIAEPDIREAIEIAKSGGTGRFQGPCTTVTGKRKWWDTIVTPIMNRDGTPQGLLCISRDITELRQAEDDLRNSEKRLRTLIDAMPLSIQAPQIVWFSDASGRLTYCNDVWYEYIGLRSGDNLSEGWEAVIHPLHRERTLTLWTQSLEAGRSFEIEIPLRRASDGMYRWFILRGQPIKNEHGKIDQWFGIAVDIHERKQSEQALRESEERLQLALKAAHMIAWEFNPQTGTTTRSANALALLGITPGCDESFMTGIHPDDHRKVENFLQRIRTDGADSVECRYVLPSGEVRWLRARAEQAGPDRIVGVTFDISEQKEAEEEIWRSANHDALTGLPNRNLFQRRLEAALEKAEQDGTSVSLLSIDLDDFKDINDTLGHDAGDAVLQETARRLSKLVRDCDTVARIGGDEFAVLVIDPMKLEDAAHLGSLIAESLRQPLTHRRRTLISRVSIGIAAFPNHDRKPAELVKDADIAMYQAKAEGRNRVVTYSPEMRKPIEHRVSLSRGIREAIAKGEIVPFYQPKVSLATGEVIGLEALARWIHPSKGILTPGFFGAVFEDHEVAASIGKLLTSKVAADVRQWIDQGLSIGRIALNLSPAEFSQEGIVDNMLSAFDRFTVPSALFEVEVTETVLLGKNSDNVSSALAALRNHGVQIALDDFGTGYASLTHLKQFPVDHIKIDQSFVSDLEHDPDDEAIIATVIRLGKSLNLQVTAEGVETHGQARRLRELGCDHAQGYLYARPMAASQVSELLSRWNAMLVKPRTERSSKARAG
ncbi:diguanylate cyclase (GGDEF)-like protein/PAS domain S-box-containing protein [Microvirga flocculans]|uniref:Diguanylate cyclase (GGDEF)-like protein/PAS domain S-box-containing protein n=1 Tax=Microvirga flocculans TaxID=217168 RepID=A0A7W6N823_9HYPH|nr:EAL domain-containing protein [Microvirga flocculans]MBB4040738.1 diguanylate cyclase (GGDEF)-like protein/PAS domain S-box-containing protein [Microvirga flocculans]